jgi:hypothetical protein
MSLARWESDESQGSDVRIFRQTQEGSHGRLDGQRQYCTIQSTSAWSDVYVAENGCLCKIWSMLKQCIGFIEHTKSLVSTRIDSPPTKRIVWTVCSSNHFEHWKNKGNCHFRVDATSLLARGLRNTFQESSASKKACKWKENAWTL